MNIFETKRLRFRNLEDRDKDALYALLSDESITKYMNIGLITQRDVEVEINRGRNRSPLDHGTYFYAVSYLKSDRLVGTIYLEKKADYFILGYAIKPEKQGHGYASEILKALIDFIIKNFEKINIEAVVDKRNIPSQKLLRKLGFQNNTYELRDFYVYSLYGDLALE